MNDISYRLKIIMDDQSIRKFAERLNMAPTTLQEYLKGRTPPADFIVRVCEQFQIEPWWLLAGKGDIRGSLPVTTADPVANYRAEQRPETKLETKLKRIVAEGNKKKIKAVEAQLDLLDPGETVQQQPPSRAFGSHVSEAAQREARAILEERIKHEQEALEAGLLNKGKGSLAGT